MTIPNRADLERFDANLTAATQVLEGPANTQVAMPSGVVAWTLATINEKTEEVKNSADAAIASIDAKVAGGYFKTYLTLADANADIANIPLNVSVRVVSDGVYYKELSSSTTLTKDPYNPELVAKEYTDEKIGFIPIFSINLDDYSLVVVDNEGNLAVGLLLKSDGLPSSYMIDAIYDGAEPKISANVVTVLAERGYNVKQSQDGSFHIVDQDDQMSWFGIKSNGDIHDYTASCIIAMLNAKGFGTIPTKYKSTYNSKEINIVSGADIVCIGDSMTAGAGGGGTRYPSVLQTRITADGSNSTVINAGVGGETSPTITARMGGYPFSVRVTSGVIPATTTPVVITFDQINGQTVLPLLQGNGGASGFIGDLAGVKGSISLVKPNGGNTWDAANYYTFTRSVAGAEVIVNRPESFVTDYAKARQGDIKIIWIGQNGPNTTRAIQDVKAIIQNMTALNKRYLVISKPTATADDDAAFFAEFGDRFIAAKKYMVEFGIYDAGITPTEQDLIDMSNYVIPLPLCASASDRLHWSAVGYTVFANLIFKKLKYMEWVS